MEKKKCAECGEEFEAKTARPKYCRRPECVKEVWRRRERERTDRKRGRKKSARSVPVKPPKPAKTAVGSMPVSVDEIAVTKDEIRLRWGGQTIRVVGGGMVLAIEAGEFIVKRSA